MEGMETAMVALKPMMSTMNKYNNNDVDNHAAADRDSSLDAKTINVLLIAEINEHGAIVAHPVVFAVACCCWYRLV